jgi:hypothetical protein
MSSLCRQWSPLLNSTQTNVPSPVGGTLSAQEGATLRSSLARSAPALTYACRPEGIRACQPHQPFPSIGAGSRYFTGAVWASSALRARVAAVASFERASVRLASLEQAPI